ncbi:expressed unknown protein [Seminavis robusta]|uniref:Uncharacterized protein n=1 Tax=Seminavis robusta TaxID=568900 RepID=A0A9N8HCY3_9STRA|nr:expressed unknown protein [Seminavis robusta]|eukprot:Sro434_g142070.1 n/a (345) ;mRNA; r:33864-34898
MAEEGIPDNSALLVTQSPKDDGDGNDMLVLKGKLENLKFLLAKKQDQAVEDHLESLTSRVGRKLDKADDDRDEVLALKDQLESLRAHMQKKAIKVRSEAETFDTGNCSPGNCSPGNCSPGNDVEANFSTVNCSEANVDSTVVLEELKEIRASSFFPYLFVTFVLNVLPLAYGLASMHSLNCHSRWLFFNTLLAAMHLGVPVYMVHLIKAVLQPQDALSADIPTSKKEGVDASSLETPYVAVDRPNDKSRTGRSRPSLASTAPNSRERIQMVLFHDKVMTTYYILCVFWMVWQAIGIKQVLDEVIDESCTDFAIPSVICGCVYLGLGVLAGALAAKRHASKGQLA